MSDTATIFGMNQWHFATIDSVALIFAALCAIFYLNERRYALTNFRCLAITLLAACAFGRGFAYFWPGDYSHLIPWMRLGLDLGLAMVFGAMAWGRLQQLFGEKIEKSFHKDVLERMVRARNSEEFELVRLAAAAALRQEGVDRRVDQRAVESHDITLAVRVRK